MADDLTILVTMPYQEADLVRKAVRDKIRGVTSEGEGLTLASANRRIAKAMVAALDDRDTGG